MYNAEVLGKFPVVQHFPFGSIFNWGTPDPNAAARPLHPSNAQTSSSRSHVVGDSPATTAPWANKTSRSSAGMSEVTTKAPWANGPSQPSGNMSGATTRAPWSKSSSGPSPDLRNPFSTTSENIMASKPGEQPTTTHAPWTAPQPPIYPTSAGMHSARPLPVGQLDGEDTKAPWAMGREEGDSSPLVQATEANLGPRRTSSPDSRLAVSLDGEEAEKRRGSLGTGGVRVAETGYLKRRQPSVG